MPRVLWIIFSLAALALIAGPIEVEHRHARALPVAEPGAEAPIGTGPFVPAGVYSTTNMFEVPQGLATRGSWLRTDEFKGTHETGWFLPRRKITVLVAGYPNNGGSHLEIEFRHRDGAVTRLPFAGGNPGEMWQPWPVRVPSSAAALRLRAVDASSEPGGWLAFSEPFMVEPRIGAQIWAVIQLVTVTCLALTLIYGPGLIWFQARERPIHAFAGAILIGPLLLVGLGLVCWALGGWITPAAPARIGVIGILAWMAWRRPRPWRLPREISVIVGAGALLVGFAVAKASYSGGPAGELFRHTVARTLAVGGHSDSGISYQVAQLVANHFAPFGAEADGYFSPWSFGSRGPLAGIASAPVILAAGAQVPRDLPDGAWQPFDRDGYATYRIAMIAMASLAAWAVFGVVARFASVAWAVLAAVVAMLAPFFVHELYFTWPKLLAAALVLVAFLLAHERKAFAAGVALGVGYLFHPLPGFSAPFLALLLLARGGTGWDARRLVPPLMCAAGVLTLVVPWQIIGRWHPGEGATAQAVFVQFFRLADNAAATGPTWWQTRWDNFAHTFLPGYLLTASPTHESLNSIYGPSDAWVRRSFLYWNTLPFALGVPGFLLAAAAIVSACRRAPGIVLITYLGPIFFLVAYWGGARTGLMRHCGHTIFLSTLVLATWSLARWSTAWRGRAVAIFLHPACFAWRAGEIGLMAFGTTLLNAPPDLTTFFGWNDVLALALAAGCLLGAAWLLWRLASSMRPRLLEEVATADSTHAPASRLSVAAPALARTMTWMNLRDFLRGPSSGRPSTISRIIFGLAVLALFIGPVWFDKIVARALPVVGTAAAGLPEAPFRPQAVFRTTNPDALPSGLATRGSWLDSDDFQGTCETNWYRARPAFTVMVAGYPALAPNRLELEYRRADETIRTLPYPHANPGENWLPWNVSLPNEAVAFRLRAVDGSSAAFGWLGISEPFVDAAFVPRQLWALLQLAATTCLALALLHGPGILWLRRRERKPRDLALAIIAGPVLLAALGLLCWLLGGWIAPATLARVGVGGLLAWIALGAWRTRGAAALPAHATTVMTAGALLVGFAVAKANFSIGPAGELFGGTASRTLAVGGHSDSRTSFHIVQLVAHHAGPFSAEAGSYYSPWSFANRGAIGGLLAAPVVLATGATPTREATQQPWQPFDREGFATYRITQIVLASLGGWAVFGAVAAVLPVAWAVVAAIIALLAPFFVHELYFTWPKLATAAFVLAAFVLGHARRPFAAGLAFAAAYLLHPLALLGVPFFGLWLLAQKPTDAPGWRRLLAPLQFAAGLVPVVVAWMLIGKLAPERTGAQMVFFDYFRLSDGKLITEAGPWWHARWENFANTFVPLHLFTVDRTHESINSVYAPSDAWVQAAFLHWNTLPFALGLPAFFLLAAGIAAATRRAFLVVLGLFILPALLLVFYWGAASTGLMRHCGHVLFVSTIVLGVWGLGLHAGPWKKRALAVFLHPACFAWRGLEIGLMAFGTTLLNRFPQWNGPFGWNDGVSLAAAAACLTSAVILLAKASAAIKHDLSASDAPARFPS